MSTQITCPKCGVYNDVQDFKCWKCNRPITPEEKEPVLRQAAIKQAEEERYNALSQEEKDRQILEKAKNLGDWSIVPEGILKGAAKKITLTTSFQLAQQEISSEVAIVTAEVAYGMNIFRDLFAGVRDIVGGRSGAVQKVLRDARNTVLFELRKEALMVGADAVIAVDLDYQELSGGEKNGMIMLIASGTAVTVVK